MYTVVGNPKNRTFRVIWMLEELGQDYEIQSTPPHSDAMRQGNPGGRSPALHDGDAIIPDSVAIVTYLADKHGGCTHQAGTPARAWQDAMTQFCVDEIEGALWTAAKNSFVHPEDKRCGGVVPTCKFEFAKAMKTLETHLDGRAFIAGDTFTVPDLLLGHCSRWAMNAKFDIPGGAVADYFTRMKDRPAYHAAMRRSASASEAAA